MYFFNLPRFIAFFTHKYVHFNSTLHYSNFLRIYHYSQTIQSYMPTMNDRVNLHTIDS